MATNNAVNTSLAGQTGTGKFVGDTAPTMTNVTINDININTDTISTITTNGNLYLEPNGTGHVDVGDPGLEVGNILIDGVAFNSRFRVNDIGNVAPAMVTIHKHSTTQEPLQIAARSNSNTSAHATVTANMPLYSMYATGWLNSYYGIFGQIRFSADSTGTLADGSAPGKLELMVTPNGTLIPVTALSISNAGVTTLANALPVGSGGSGRTTATAYGVICGGTTSTGAHQSIASVGTAGQVLTSNGAGALPTFQNQSGPTIQSFTTGSGTYTTPAGVKYVVVELVGGGGGGGGGGTTGAGIGVTGGTTTFGSLSATGGTGGAASGNAGGWGATSPGIGSGGDVNAAGGTASPLFPGNSSLGTPTNGYAPAGGNSIYGGGGLGGSNGGDTGKNATGFGGGGGGAGGTNAGGGITATVGGSGGGYCRKLIGSPAATYSYSVGVGGASGAVGTNGAAGGAGSGGIIIVTEYYQ